jgi:NAD(P)-dependent dehydrogenase (short-subunit alcohol dehydrogenase family)
MSLNPSLTDWHGKRVWLVGASSGLGRATAEALHAQGARVIVSARRQSALEEFVHGHPGSQAMALDVTDRSALETAAFSLLEQGPLDLVFYCAGHYRPMRATAIELDELLLHQQINLTGALTLTAAVTPALIRHAKAGNTPHLCFVSSVAGLGGLPQSLAYGPTKAALINLAEVLFLDLRPLGVGLSVVNPGFIDTDLTAQNTFTMPALLTPAQAAKGILNGWARGDFEIHFPRRFTLALKLLKLLPYRWYFPLIHRVTGL